MNHPWTQWICYPARWKQGEVVVVVAELQSMYQCIWWVNKISHFNNSFQTPGTSHSFQKYQTFVSKIAQWQLFSQTMQQLLYCLRAFWIFLNPLQKINSKNISTYIYRVFLSTVTNRSSITDTTVRGLTQIGYFSCSIHQDIWYFVSNNP